MIVRFTVVQCLTLNNNRTERYTDTLYHHTDKVLKKTDLSQFVLYVMPNGLLHDTYHSESQDGSLETLQPESVNCVHHRRPYEASNETSNST